MIAWEGKRWTFIDQKDILDARSAEKVRGSDPCDSRAANDYVGCAVHLVIFAFNSCQEGPPDGPIRENDRRHASESLLNFQNEFSGLFIPLEEYPVIGMSLASKNALHAYNWAV